MQAASVVLNYGVGLSPKWRRLLRKAIRISIISAIIAALAFGLWWWAVLRPYRRLQAMLEASASRAPSPAEFHAAAHDVLRFYCADPHDAFIVLIDYGDSTSIPYLIRSLWWQGDTPPHGVMICTKEHCLKALRKLTARNLGDNYEDWAPLLHAWPASRTG
jgi:hypothetical protein